MDIRATPAHLAAGGEVFIVDDDAAVRNALVLVFSLEGYQVAGFAEGMSFLSAARVRTPACILLDVNMPGRSGLDLLKELNAQQYSAPLFIMSGQANIPMAVDAIRHGAIDFIEKPFDADTVVGHVRGAIAAAVRLRDIGDGLPPFAGRELLTPRECEVLTQIAAGASNKQAGRTLGISPRTVEVHRARIMEKLGARNAAELVGIVLGRRVGH
jgi:FixJ family two-component response regulator